MSKSAATVLALLAALLAIGTPLYYAIHEARELALEAETGRALNYALDVLHRTDETLAQIQSGIKRLDANQGDDPCSVSNLALMRDIDLSSSYIQAIGSVSGDALVCSSLGVHEPGLPLGPVDLVTSRGVKVRSQVKFMFAPESTFLVIEQDGYAAIIHRELPIDATTHAIDISLATFALENDNVTTTRGFIKPEWIQRLGDREQTTFFDSGYVVAVVKSRDFLTGSLAAVPVSYLNERIGGFTYYLVPIGLIAGIVLALAILYLTRLQLALPAVIRTALRRGEFFMVYQPIVHLANGEWIGAEALIRWRRPNGEMIRPDLFIAAAEESGLIRRITEHIIGLVQKDAAGFFSAHPNFHISINVSSEDLHSRRTVDLITNAAREMSTEPHNLLIEATERGFLDPEAARAVVHELHSHGIQVAIDDFGTGYSSLSYLETFDLDYLKIDKSFVDTIGTEAATSQVILHIIEMAKSLKLEIVAEGVETQAQAEFLRQRGVHFAQGWLFSKPLAFIDLVASFPSSGTADET